MREEKLESWQSLIRRKDQCVRKEAGKTSLNPEIPRDDESNEKKEIRPMKERLETETPFPKNNGDQNANSRKVENRDQALGQASEAKTKPYSREPRPAELAALITANGAIDR